MATWSCFSIGGTWRRRGAEELRDIPNREAGTAEFGHRRRCLTVYPATELRQRTAKFEDSEHLLGHLGAIQLRRPTISAGSARLVRRGSAHRRTSRARPQQGVRNLASHLVDKPTVHGTESLNQRWVDRELAGLRDAEDELR